MKTEKEVKKQIEMLKEYKGILEKNGSDTMDLVMIGFRKQRIT